MKTAGRALRHAASLVAAGTLLAALAAAPTAAATFTLPHQPGTTVYDEAGVVSESSASAIPSVMRAADADAGRPDPVFYVHRLADAAGANAAADAEALVEAWRPSDPAVDRTLLVMLDVAGDPACPTDVAVRVGPAWSDILSAAAVTDLVSGQLRPALSVGCDPDMILLSAAGGLTVAASAGVGGGSSGGSGGDQAGVPGAPPAGPPWPEPVEGQRVYDFAGVFSPATIAATEAAIDRIEARTGAQIAVYTQVKPYADSTSTEQDAISLMDAWGVGRKGFDDGLVILWNLDESLRHGQVQLYAGPGYRNIVSNEQRQSIYENDMVPYLKDGDLDAAMTVAMQRLEELTTPENAGRLQFFRQANAVIGLGGIVLFVVLAIWPVLTWFRRGRDPAVAQSGSMHMPDPPAGMTPAAGSVLLQGKSSRRALTAAMLDLASRGELVFEQEETGRFIKSEKLAVRTTRPALDDPRVVLNRRPPIGAAEEYILRQVDGLADGEGLVSPEKLLELGGKVSTFDTMIERAVTDLGWFAGPPGKVRARWAGLGSAELVLGIVAFVLGSVLPSSGLAIVAGAIAAAGVVTLIVAPAMPARTRQGALMRVWLDGYRRTLEATMRLARSMDEVVERSGLAWLETPDRAVAWGTALGLQDEIEKVLERSVEDLREGRSSGAWYPAWYNPGPSHAGWGSAGAGGVAPGLMSATVVPDFGGMMAALGTIGNSPSSSGSGGGFGGGGSGGGGGGAGGGF